MIIYNPYNEKMIVKRILESERLLGQIPAKHCFITGSFLYKEKYNDIDLFAITRRKKEIVVDNKKAKITLIDFNDLHSLFYHSISKSCVSKNILPTKDLKVTIAEYGHVVNEAIPTIINQKNKYKKEVRFLILYTEYFKTSNILDTFQLNQRIKQFKNYKEILEYVKEEVPKAIKNKIKKSYLKRFFYTKAAFYKDSLEYEAQNYLYGLTHEITSGIADD